MVSALDSGSGGLGSSPGRVLGQATLLVALLSTLVYKWIPGNLLLGVTLRWTSIPSILATRNTPSCFMIRKPR